MVDERKQILEHLEKDYLAFCRRVMPHTLHARTPEIHSEWSDLLMDRAEVEPEAEFDGHGMGGLVYRDGIKNTQILLESPRDTAKSTMIAGGYALYHAVYFRDNVYVLLQCKTLGEAKKRLRKISNIFNYSPEFKLIYGYCGEDSPGVVKWTEEKITLRVFNPLIGRVVEWTFEAKGYGQPTRGLKEDDQRLTLYIGDDVEDEENTKTLEAMDKNFNKFLSIKAGIDLRGKQIVIGTPVHQSCLVERLKNMKGWQCKTYHTIDEENKTSLWEERLPYEDMIREKESLESVHKLSYYYSERQCVITGDEDQLFREEDLRYWDGEYFVNEDGFGCLKITHLGTTSDVQALEEPKLLPVNVHLGVDPASSVSKRADYSVTLPIAYGSDGKLYALPYFEKRVRPTHHADDIEAKGRKYKPVRTHVESVGYQEALRDILKRRTEEDENFYLPGISIKWQAGKESKDERLEALEDFVREHRLHLMVNMDRFKEEMLLFPRGRKNILDAFWYATRKLIKPYHTVKKDKKEKANVKVRNWMAA